MAYAISFFVHELHKLHEFFSAPNGAVKTAPPFSKEAV
jgi:hypothetical protein